MSKQNPFQVGRKIYFHKSVDFDLDFLASAVESGYQVDAVYADLMKGFDRSDYWILRSKLHSLGVGCNLLN